MPLCEYAKRELPFLADFSPEDRRLAEQALGENDERLRKANALRASKADQLLQDFHQKLHEILGIERLGQLREGIKQERLTFADLWQPPEGLDRDYDEQKRASKQKIEALIRQLGASPQQLETIGREFQERLEGALSATDGKVVRGYNLAKHLDEWNKLSPLHKFPLPWGSTAEDDPTNPHRWFLFQPPFFGFLFDFEPITSSNFEADRLLFLNPSAGLVGNEATMDCDDAGDFDFASATAEAQIAVGFVPPTTGVVEVLIDAQSTVGAHHLEIEDEFGFSNAWCNQNNYLMMNVLHPNVPEPSLSLMSNLYRETDGDDLNADRENLTRGSHYFARLFSSGPVPAGRSVVVTAGTRTFDIARANDMELHSRSNFQWFINSIEVRIAP